RKLRKPNRSRLLPRPDHRLDIDELFARGAFAGSLFLGLLDLLPVAERDEFEAALGRQRVEAGTTCFAPVAERASFGVFIDLVDHRIAVGPVGPDRPRRAAACPSDA